MKVKKTIQLFLLFILAFVQLTTNVIAQDNAKGRITGQVIDKLSNEPMIGVVVFIDGTTVGVQTDIEGRYELNNLAPGTYNILFRYVAYKTKLINDVIVKPGESVSLNMLMEDNAISTKEAVVTGSYKKESIGALYTIQKNNIAISDGISADIIKRSPDKNTSDVLKRVSGTTVQDNKFVVIRGLADRYNTATINNAILPSTEPDRKAFSFDIIPSNLIDHITINKTASANLPGDFAGGVIQIVTRDIPEDNFIDFSLSYGFNTQSVFKKFMSNGRGKYDYFGFSDGSRALPNNFPTTRQKYASLSLEKQLSATRSLGNGYIEQESIALPSQSYQVTYGAKKELKNNTYFSSLTSLTYRNEQRINPSNRLDYDGPNAVFNYENTQYKFNTSLGALANFTYAKGNSKYSFKNIYNKIFDESYLERTGDNLNNLNNIRFNSNELTQKGLLESQLEGNHRISENNANLSWNINYALISSSQPDLRTLFYNRPIDQKDASYTLVDRNSRRFFSELIENNFGANASLTLPFQLLYQKSALKLGILNQTKIRAFEARIFNYTKAKFTNSDSILFLPKNEIFDEENISENGFVLNEFTNNSDKYDANSALNVAFLMLDNQLGSHVKLNWGVRLEVFDQNIDAVDATSAKIKSNNKYIDVLPSINFTYEINSKVNYRLSASRTVSRPEFRELAPFEFYDFTTNSSLVGNPNLKRGRNYNVDSRIEYYPGAGETMNFTVFYKHFDNPIEQIVNSSSNADLRRLSYANATKATISGVEFEFRKKLRSVLPASFLENLTVFASTALIYSEVDLANQGNIKRALQGQSPYLINAGLQYTSKDNLNAISILYNRVGQRILTVGFQGYPDVYENARNLVDLQIARKVLKRKAEIKLNVSDLLNQKQIFYQNLDNKKAYSSSDDRVINSVRFGTSISVGFSYNLGLL